LTRPFATSIRIRISPSIAGDDGLSYRHRFVTQTIYDAAVVTVRTVVARAPAACWRAFTDAATFGAWVPGLRRAQVIQAGADGLPTEILFEFGASRTYTLVYTYDHTAREVRWRPGIGKLDAVAGFARFDPLDDGTSVTYGLERHDGDADLSEVHALVTAFSQWMHASAR
jgi:hypothetical protein